MQNMLMAIIGDIQALLLTIMCSIANSYIAGKSSRTSVPESAEQTEDCYLVDAAISFFKLQHLNLNVTIKSQVRKSSPQISLSLSVPLMCVCGCCSLLVFSQSCILTSFLIYLVRPS